MIKGLLPFYLLTFLPFNTMAGNVANYEVVPLPQSIVMQKGEPFVLNGDVQIFAGDDLQQEAKFLQMYLKDITGISLSLASKREKKKIYIELAVSPKVTTPEGYVLTIDKKGISIVGGSSAGVFYGIQTLRKSISPSTLHLPPSTITDAPRFA